MLPDVDLSALAATGGHACFRIRVFSSSGTSREALSSSHVYVTVSRSFGVSAVNPYPFESRDAAIFDALRPSLAEVSLFVQFPQ